MIARLVRASKIFRAAFGSLRVRTPFQPCIPVFAAFIFGLALVEACNRPVARELQSITPTTPAVTQTPCGPVKVAVLTDQTPSATWTRTPQLHPRDFSVLIDLVMQCGGEVGVSPIRDRHDYSRMVRLTIETLPLPPPVAPREDQNIFQLNIEENRFKREEDAYHQRVAQRQAEISRLVAKFQTDLGEILDRHPAVHASAVCDALARGDLFLSEPYYGWRSTPQLYMIAVSDGADTYSKHPCPPLSSRARFAVVNGSGSLASLRNVSPLRFESFEAAVDYIIRKENK